MIKVVRGTAADRFRKKFTAIEETTRVALAAGDRGLREREEKSDFMNSMSKRKNRRIRGSHAREILAHVEVLVIGRSDDDPLEKGRKVHLTRLFLVQLPSNHLPLLDWMVR